MTFVLLCRCAFFEKNSCIQFTVCASLSDLDYLRKVETEPTKVLMLDSNHQVRTGLLMSVLVKVRTMTNMNLPSAKGRIGGFNRLFLFTATCTQHSICEVFCLTFCQLALQTLFRHCGSLSMYMQTLLTVTLSP